MTKIPNFNPTNLNKAHKHMNADKEYFQKQLIKQVNKEIYLPQKIDIFDKMDEVQLQINNSETAKEINIFSTKIGQLNKKLSEINQKINNTNLKKQ